MNLSQPEFHDALWLFLLIPFGIVVGAGLIFSVAAMRWLREARWRRQFNQFEAMLPNGEPRRLFLERPPVWIAIKGHDLQKVQAALGLHNPTLCSWEDGWHEAHEDKLFISPPVTGWIFVVGSDLPEPGEDVDQCFHFLQHLSRQVGHLQYFCTRRALRQHAWAIVDHGQVFRAYAWAGKTVWNQGPVTSAEKDLRVHCFPYGEEADFTQWEKIAANTEKVNALAARWSLDPAAVIEKAWPSERGIVGHFSLPKPH